MRTIRRAHIRMVFQDPMTELNPFINKLLVGVGIYSLYKLNNRDFVAGLQRSVKAGVIRTVELGKNQ
ncbi:hypothetical protein [Gilliamella apis]|uniref:hypothetical protein n=1 Tax=Gilliamella apis TaxID=1970738 RepID=UPI001C2BB301|nr:hypothetical protein [Gilliamella apis]